MLGENTPKSLVNEDDIGHAVNVLSRIYECGLRTHLNVTIATRSTLTSIHVELQAEKHIRASLRDRT
jgi:hypothetical protein